MAIWHEFGNRAYLSLSSARLGAAVLALLAELKRRLSPGRFAAAEARGRALQLDATITAILAEALVSHAP